MLGQTAKELGEVGKVGEELSEANGELGEVGKVGEELSEADGELGGVGYSHFDGAGKELELDLDSAIAQSLQEAERLGMDECTPSPHSGDWNYQNLCTGKRIHVPQSFLPNVAPEQTPNRKGFVLDLHRGILSIPQFPLLLDVNDLEAHVAHAETSCQLPVRAFGTVFNMFHASYDAINAVRGVCKQAMHIDLHV